MYMVCVCVYVCGLLTDGAGGTEGAGGSYPRQGLNLFRDVCTVCTP